MKGNTNAVNGISRIMLHGQKLPITNQSVTIPDISKTAYGVAKAGEGIKVQNGVISSQSSVMNHVQLTCQEPAGDKLVLIDDKGKYFGNVSGVPPFGYFIENPGAVTKTTSGVEYDYESSSYSGAEFEIIFYAFNVLDGSNREVGRKTYYPGMTEGVVHGFDPEVIFNINAEEIITMKQGYTRFAGLMDNGNNFARMPITYLIPE